eukprot:Gb_04492 [translate_table: standard]
MEVQTPLNIAINSSSWFICALHESHDTIGFELAAWSGSPRVIWRNSNGVRRDGVFPSHSASRAPVPCQHRRIPLGIIHSETGWDGAACVDGRSGCRSNGVCRRKRHGVHRRVRTHAPDKPGLFGRPISYYKDPAKSWKENIHSKEARNGIHSQRARTEEDEIIEEESTTFEDLQRHGYCYTQKLFLVNVKLKWVKDRGLDHVVEKKKDLKPVIALKDIVKKETGACLPISAVSKRNKELGLRIRVSRFLRQYPTIFEEYVGEKYNLPWFRLTKEALELEEEEQRIHEQQEADTAARLCKLLMITTQKKLPLQMIDQLKWDLGLPDNYLQSLVPNYPDYFSIINMPDNQPGLDLVCWNDEFAISALQKGAAISGEYQKGMPLAFPMNYSSGHGIKKKVIEWIKEWQNLPYISPYEDASHLNPNSDLSEKRVVGVLHELLNIMVHKKAERCNLVNLREQLGLPHKFAKCFARHPGIFYLSMKNGTITVILREAYKRAQLIQKDPLMSLREKYIHLMKKGVENRRKGLYKKRSSERQDSEDVESDKGLQKCDDDGEHSYADEESQEENVSTEDEDSDDKDLSEDEDDMDEDEDGVDEDGDEDEDDALTDAESSPEEYEEFFERGVRTCGRGHSSFKTSERQGSSLYLLECFIKFYNCSRTRQPIEVFEILHSEHFCITQSSPWRLQQGNGKPSCLKVRCERINCQEEEEAVVEQRKHKEDNINIVEDSIKEEDPLTKKWSRKKRQLFVQEENKEDDATAKDELGEEDLYVEHEDIIGVVLSAKDELSIKGGVTAEDSLQVCSHSGLVEDRI